MDRILSIGSELELADKSISWYESCNIKDFDRIFFDISALPVFDNKNVVDVRREINIPSDTNIRKATKAGSDLFFILPTDESALLIEQDHRSFSYFSFLPFNLDLKLEQGRTLSSVDENWSWYFNNELDWGWTILSDNYNVNEEENPITEETGELVFQKTALAKNRVGEDLSVKLTAGEVDGSRVGAEIVKQLNWWDGGIYILPLIEEYSYSQLAEEILYNIYEADLHTETDDTPEWLSDYTLPDEQEILDEISELRKELKTKQSQLEGVQKYKELLYEYGTTLEDTVHKSFRDMGFDVEDEKSGRRDGSIRLSDRRLILEIHGTNGGVPLSKCRQLDDWVERVIAEGENDVSGLFVVNPMRKEDRPSQARC